MKKHKNAPAQSEGDFFFSVREGNDGVSSLAFLHELTRRYQLLTFEEELELARRIEKGDEEAFNTLVCSNMRLSLWIASKYAHWSRMPYLDMVQEGLIGVMRAARKYDYRRKIRFSTYATWWVRQAIGRAIMKKEKMIAIPIHLQRFCSQVIEASVELAGEDGNIPTAESLASHLKANVHRVREALRVLRMDMTSLDEVVNPSLEESQTIGEQLPNQTYLGPLEMAVAKSEQESIARWIELTIANVRGVASPRDFRIFQSYYGLDNDSVRKSDEEIALEAGLGKRAVRTVIANIWKKLAKFEEHLNEPTFVNYLRALSNLEELTATQVSVATQPSRRIEASVLPSAPGIQ